MTYNSDMTAFTLYDLQGNRLGANARPAGLAVYTPLTLLDDGRVVLLIGKTSASTQLATIPADAFFERQYRVYRDGVCGVSVIAQAVFTGRKQARVVGDADPYG